jgi:hypothetical protein
MGRERTIACRPHNTRTPAPAAGVAPSDEVNHNGTFIHRVATFPRITATIKQDSEPQTLDISAGKCLHFCRFHSGTTELAVADKPFGSRLSGRSSTNSNPVPTPSKLRVRSVIDVQSLGCLFDPEPVTSVVLLRRWVGVGPQLTGCESRGHYCSRLPNDAFITRRRPQMLPLHITCHIQQGLRFLLCFLLLPFLFSSRHFCGA